MWYNYDGLGKRRNKLFADPDDLHWYRWAGWSVLSEYDTTGASGWEIPAAAARVDVAGLAERDAGAAYAYRLHDHLGSVRGLSGASKAPLARYAYAPYGELNHGAGRPLRRGFTGHHWDAESGMYYAPFRYYMPGAGRWLSPDPLGMVDGPNVYGYVGGKPINAVDELGLAESSSNACARHNPRQFMETVSPNDVDANTIRTLWKSYRKQMKGHARSIADHARRRAEYFDRGDYQSARNMQNHIDRIVNTANHLRRLMQDYLTRWSCR